MLSSLAAYRSLMRNIEAIPKGGSGDAPPGREGEAAKMRLKPAHAAERSQSLARPQLGFFEVMHAMRPLDCSPIASSTS